MQLVVASGAKYYKQVRCFYLSLFMICPQNNLKTKDVVKRGRHSTKVARGVAPQPGALAPALILGVPRKFSFDVADLLSALPRSVDTGQRLYKVNKGILH